MARNTAASFFYLFVFVIGAFAYNPPIGIPNPTTTWGALDPIDTPNPTASTYAPGWFAGTPRANNIAAGDAHDCYYIDNSAVGATDTSNTYGYPGHPRATIPNIVYSAGSYVEIHGDGATGTYKYTGTFNPHGVGTASAPIWFVGVSQPILSGTLDLGASDYTNTAYMIFDGLKWASGGRADLRPRYANNSIDHICMRNLEQDGGGVSGSGITLGQSSPTDPTQTIQDVVIYNCNVHDNGNKDASNDECNIYPHAYVTRFWVLDSQIHGAAEDGLGGSHGGQRTSSYYYIGRNQIYDNQTNALDIKGYGKGVVVSQNNMHGTVDVWTRYTSGALVVGQQCQWIDVSGSPDFSNIGAGSPPYTVGTRFTPTGTTPTSWGTAIVDEQKSSGLGDVMPLHYGGLSSGSKSYLYYPEDVSILYNTVRDGRFGIYLSNMGRLRVIGNVFYNQHEQSVIHGTSQPCSIFMGGLKDDAWIVNNTFYNMDAGIQVNDVPAAYDPAKLYYRGYTSAYGGATYVCIDDNSDAGITGIAPTDSGHWKTFRLQIWGNIFIDRTVASRADISFAGTTFATNSEDVDYNDVYNAAFGENYAWGSASQNQAWMKANTTLEAHSIHSDPLLVDPTNATPNFQLQSGSPAIDSSTAGTSTTAYADFLAAYGLSVQVDANGNVRPVGAGWDMGPYESGSDSGVPTPPTNLKIIPP